MDKVPPLLGTGQAIFHVPSTQTGLIMDDKETAEELGQRVRRLPRAFVKS